MFDTFRGLPMHAIVIHATVVFLPLMALVTVVVAVLPRLRRFAWWVAAADLGIIALTWVTIQTGEAFQKRLGGQVAQHHAELARKLPAFTIAMFVAAVLVALARKARPASPAGIATSVLSIITAGALVFWTIQVGEAGARAVFGGVIASTSAK